MREVSEAGFGRPAQAGALGLIALGLFRKLALGRGLPGVVRPQMFGARTWGAGHGSALGFNRE